LHFALLAAYWGIEGGQHAVVRGRVRMYCAGRFLMGRAVRINSGWTNYVGGGRRTAIWVGQEGVLRIGESAAISNTCIVAVNGVTIGEFAYIGGGCAIWDTDFHSIDASERELLTLPAPSAPVSIGPHAFIGGYSTVLKGVSIGEGAVVGACSVVTKPIPAGEVWAGNPARRVGYVPSRTTGSSP